MSGAMGSFDEQIDQVAPAVFGWETSPVTRMVVTRAWIELARLTPQPPTYQGDPHDHQHHP